ncbi:uncharacterized protein BKA55DRAFT_599093 [Fusarium redolens]|uniref:C2H2-type domain-containing protein n=1 Tax=Fusarium redolens TaxID=48865 RepID=A0A9P9JUX4_FUSRE|nr:uncharacterized protein BKA55DRAFT_599093 [Fusarium redolens]KAH7228596.1 hypothetical protein BKA55DRAFT_599093 [Fusarium redolens]
MTSADQDLPNGLSIHTFTEVDFASQLLSHYITQDYDGQERAPVSVPRDYENTCAPGQYTEQPTPLVSHNICNDVSQGETGSPTSTDIDNYPFKCGQLGCGYAFSGKDDQLKHIKKCKLVLKILDWRKSVENWTPEEQANRRRIVLFHRTQIESKVEAICQPVSIKERIINCICISCIWWAEKGECYVTSVDIIHLLEQLIVAPSCFRVEEKNRIHFYKTKPDTQKFFKIIMGFPDPKPLSIGEDVKVFPWENLDSALEKIIRSYTVLSSLTAPDPDAGSGQRELATPETRDTPEIETLTDDYPNTYHVTPLHDPTLPEGFYAHQDGSQLPMEELQPRHVSVCQLPGQKNSPIDPALTSNVQLDSNSELARTHRESTPRAKATKKKKGQRNKVVLSCSFCTKTFSGRHRKREHERHQRTHTRERPYICKWKSCGKRYPRPDHMTRHAKICRHKPAALVTNDGVSESPSKFPHRGRPTPDSNPPSLQNELDLPGTLIQDESDSEPAEDEIVVCLRPEQDHHKQNAPTLPLDKHIDGVDDTYQDTEEKARGSKLSVTYDNDDWGYAIADGKITIYYKNTLLTNFDRGIQHEVPGDIKQQQEGGAEAEQIHIKRRTRAMTQRNISFSENTDAQQCREETHATIDELQKMLPESKGLDLSRISVCELDDILKAVWEVLNTIRQVLIKSWIEKNRTCQAAS